MERKGNHLTVYENYFPTSAAEFSIFFFINSEGKPLTSGLMKIELHDWAQLQQRVELSQEEVLNQSDALHITSDWKSLGRNPTYCAMFPYASVVVPIQTSLRALAVKILFLFLLDKIISIASKAGFNKCNSQWSLLSKPKQIYQNSQVS